MASTAWGHLRPDNPRPTVFLRQAQQYGAIIDGLEMLVQQGAAVLEMWQGSVLVDVMRDSATASEWAVG